MPDLIISSRKSDASKMFTAIVWAAKCRFYSYYRDVKFVKAATGSSSKIRFGGVNIYITQVVSVSDFGRIG